MLNKLTVKRLKFMPLNIKEGVQFMYNKYVYIQLTLED